MIGKVVLLAFGAATALTIPFRFVSDSWNAALLGLLSLACYLLGTEFLFRAYYRLRTGAPYRCHPRVPFEEIYVEPHPYLPYVYKRNGLGQRRQAANYPLHAGRFQLPAARFNNFRLCDGLDGGREIVVPKPSGVVRVLCLGASTTVNDLEEQGQRHTYPLHLERIMSERFPGQTIEVVNGGAGGRTSAEILVDFALNLIEMQPDLVVLYHAYNDLGPSLTPGFAPDYSHARKSLGETYHLLRWAAKFPNLPLALYTHLVESIFAGNVRYGLISAISRAEPDLNLSFQGTATYRRNIEHLLDLCQARGIRVVLSSFCHFFYPGIEDSFVHRKYAEGVALENSITLDLATRRGLPYADAAALIPLELENYVDFVHFTPAGMRRLAEVIADKLEPLVKDVQRERSVLREPEGPQ